MSSADKDDKFVRQDDDAVVGQPVDQYQNDPDDVKELAKRASNNGVIAVEPRNFVEKIKTFFVNSYVEIFYFLLCLEAFYCPTWLALTLFSCASVCILYESYISTGTPSAYGDAAHKKEILISLKIGKLCALLLLAILFGMLSFKGYKIYDILGK